MEVSLINRKNKFSRGGTLIRNCKECKRDFISYRCRKSIFCGAGCMAKNKEFREGISKRQKGYKPTDEALKNMSLSHLGKPNNSSTKFKKGNIPPYKGKKIPKEVVEKMVKTHKENRIKNGYIYKIPKDNYKEIRHSRIYDIWRTSVFARDNWICQKYKIRGGKIHAHHINNFADYPELRFAIDNGITLSEKAHKEFHKIYGIRHNTREQLLDYLNNYNAN